MPTPAGPPGTVTPRNFMMPPESGGIPDKPNGFPTVRDYRLFAFHRGPESVHHLDAQNVEFMKTHLKSNPDDAVKVCHWSAHTNTFVEMCCVTFSKKDMECEWLYRPSTYPTTPKLKRMYKYSLYNTDIFCNIP
jgi:hypothetical protein